MHEQILLAGFFNFFWSSGVMIDQNYDLGI